MKQYEVKLNWVITDKRNIHMEPYMCGTSTLLTSAKNQIEAINNAIIFAADLPFWEYKRNNIDESLFKDGCRWYGKTQITDIISIKLVK